MEKTLAVIIERDEDILSAGIRRSDGHVIVQIGDHDGNWHLDAERSTETHCPFKPR